jgi:hypothetical protein
MPFAGLDFHTHRQFFPLSMMLHVGAPIDEISILTSLTSRQFQASAFGCSIERFADGMGRTLSRAETCRRLLASLYRRLLANNGQITNPSSRRE